MLFDLLKHKVEDVPIVGGYDGPFVITSRHTRTILHSENLIDWASATAPAPIMDIAYGNGVYVIVCTDNKVYSSPDLINWTCEFLPATTPRTIAYGNNRFVVICSLWHGYVRVIGGPGWEYVKYNDKNNEKYINKLKFINNYFVLTKGYAYFDYSLDGFNWGESYYNGAPDHYDSIYVNNKFVLATNAGCRIGENIGALPAPAPGSHVGYSQKSIAYGNGIFVMSIASYGNLYSSPDCLNWVYRGTTGYDSSCGLFRKGLFVFGDNIGRISKSPDGINWTDVPNAFKNSNFSVSKIL